MTFMKNDGDLKGCLLDIILLFASGCALGGIILLFQENYFPWFYSVYYRIFPRIGSPFIDALLPGIIAVASIWVIHRLITAMVKANKGSK